MTEGRTPHAGLALALVLALVPATATVAADNSDQANQSGSSASANASGNASGMAPEDVTDKDLEKFAAAYQELQKVRAEYGKKMQQASGDKAKQKQLRKEGQQEMVSAIQDEGLKIAEYRQIGKALNQDKELRSRLQSMMKEQKGGDSGSGSGSG